MIVIFLAELIDKFMVIVVSEFQLFLQSLPFVENELAKSIFLERNVEDNSIMQRNCIVIILIL